MKYFSNIYIIFYSVIIALIAFFIFEFTGYRVHSGNGFTTFIIFVILSLFITIMNGIYKVKKGDNHLGYSFYQSNDCTTMTTTNNSISFGSVSWVML
ncbi:Uncharacterised protein [Staphylococcus hyicus]|nr:Uncharacterised protein [Staphylococcus aureus]VTS64977.1 Uncharacterised protein [Staphylococcus hyicus]SUK33341.1 Uncharacterised protein [Staphylococcus aureus]SUK65255.1 Uncharacterised protein [Staphylococcus aureus]SUK66333.1 Uncharacterised protein [Staphylococcus aureus]